MQDTLKFKVAVSFFLGWGQFMSVAFKKKNQVWLSVMAEQTLLWTEAVHSWWSILSWKQTAAFCIPVNLDAWTGVCDADVAQPKDWGGGEGGPPAVLLPEEVGTSILHSMAAGGGGGASPQGQLSEVSGSISHVYPFRAVAQELGLHIRLDVCRPCSFLKLPPCQVSCCCCSPPPSVHWVLMAFLHISRF